MTDIAEAVKKAKELSKKRNFVQTIDLAINIKGVDLKKPENSIVEDVYLPKGKGKPSRVGVIGKDIVVRCKGEADHIIDEKMLSSLEQDKKALKKIASSCDFFVAEAPLMLRIGKSLGRVLGPRGKMPKPVPPTADPLALIKRLKNTVRLSLKKSPVVHCAVGTEDMNDEDLKENIEAVLNALQAKLPNREHNIASVYVKTTMGPAVKVK